MKKVLLVGSLTTDQGEAAAVEEMKKFVGQAIDRSEVSLAICHLDELAFIVHNDGEAVLDMHNGVNVTHYDLVFFRGKLRSAVNHVALLAYYLQKNNIPFVNTAYKKWRAVGKVAQMFQMSDAGLPIIHSVSSAAKFLPVLVAEELEYPLVVKDVHGGHGRHNFLVRSEAELTAVLAEHPEKRFMAQNFVPNNGDYRILLIGDKVRVLFRQGADDSHLNNTSQGGSATLVETTDFPKEVLAMAQKFAALCDYEFAGVDVMQDSNTGKYYFLEINSQPQIASGAFVPEKSKLVGQYFRELLDLTD